MRKLVVSEWMTLDGVFDGDTMEKWFMPFQSAGRAAHISEVVEGCGALVLGRTTFEMLGPYWSAQKNDEQGPAAKLNSVPKYVVSSTLKKAEWNNSTIITVARDDELIRVVTGTRPRVGVALGAACLGPSVA